MIITQGYISGNMCTHGYGAMYTEEHISECRFLSFYFGTLDTNYTLKTLGVSTSLLTDTQLLNCESTLSAINMEVTHFKKLNCTYVFSVIKKNKKEITLDITFSSYNTTETLSTLDSTTVQTPPLISTGDIKYLSVVITFKKYHMTAAFKCDPQL